jgi:hypothetical protein
MKSIVAFAAFLFTFSSVSAITIDMVSIGNPGNAPDTRYNSISVGSVDHVYQIGKYEVTAGQYTEFLAVTLLVEQRSDTVVAEIPSATTATSTGSRVFGHTLDDSGWGNSDANPETLRGNFQPPARLINIDFIGNGGTTDVGFLRI